MRVSVKEGMSGFIYGNLHTEGKEITLKPVTCIRLKDSQGNARILTPEDQFSDVWMDKVKGKPGRKAKEISGDES